MVACFGSNQLFRMLADAAALIVLGLQRQREHASLAQHLAAGSEHLAIVERLAAQAMGDMLDEETAHPRMERRGTSHDLVKLGVGECERHGMSLHCRIGAAQLVHQLVPCYAAGRFRRWRRYSRRNSRTRTDGISAQR